jgi:hypothetical protein
MDRSEHKSFIPRKHKETKAPQLCTQTKIKMKTPYRKVLGEKG